MVASPRRVFPPAAPLHPTYPMQSVLPRLRAASPRRFPLLIAAILVAAWPLGSLRAQNVPGGAIRGQVSNAGTAENLQNVRVAVVENNREAYTARDGTFEFAGLAPGSYTLAFEYPGLDRKTVTVAVEAERTTRQDM